MQAAVKNSLPYWKNRPLVLIICCMGWDLILLLSSVSFCIPLEPMYGISQMLGNFLLHLTTWMSWHGDLLALRINESTLFVTLCVKNHQYPQSLYSQACTSIRMLIFTLFCCGEPKMIRLEGNLYYEKDQNNKIEKHLEKVASWENSIFIGEKNK